MREKSQRLRELVRTVSITTARKSRNCALEQLVLSSVSLCASYVCIFKGIQCFFKCKNFAVFQQVICFSSCKLSNAMQPNFPVDPSKKSVLFNALKNTN